MYRYIRSSDYFPTTSRITSAQYNNSNYRYFFPPPIIPYTNGSDLNRRTHFCGSSTHIGHAHCIENKDCQEAKTTPCLREHSLKKILPWRSQPELMKETAATHQHQHRLDPESKSHYTGRDLKNISNSAAVFEPLARESFPNLVTGSNVLAAQGIRSHTWAGTKYSPKEWTINTHQLLTGAECIHNNVTLVKTDVKHCIDENTKNQMRCRIDTEKDLDKRINEVEHWTNRLKTELENNVAVFHQAQILKQKVETVLQNLEKPLDISRHNLHQRESKQGIELVHDNVEECLFREIEAIRKSKNELQNYSTQLNSHLQKLRGARHELEMDISNKQYAHGTDLCVQSLNEKSSNILIGKYTSSEKDRNDLQNRSSNVFIPYSHSSPSSWLANTQSIIQKSTEERHLTENSIHQTHECLNRIANECVKLWCQTSNSYVTRITEISQAAQILEAELQRVKSDISQIHSQRIQIKKIIDEKQPLLQLAQTRLEKRQERSGLELCHDKVMISLLQEIHVLKTAIQELMDKYSNLNQLHEELINTKSKFENDLKLKKLAYNIDACKCLAQRREFCMNNVFQV